VTYKPHQCHTERSFSFPGDSRDIFRFLDTQPCLGGGLGLGPSATNKTKQLRFGVQRSPTLAFPVIYNPQGANQYGWGWRTRLGGFLPRRHFMAAQQGGQARYFPVPVIRERLLTGKKGPS